MPPCSGAKYNKGFDFTLSWWFTVAALTGYFCGVSTIEYLSGHPHTDAAVKEVFVTQGRTVLDKLQEQGMVSQIFTICRL